MLADYFLYTGLSLLIVHEMDAIRRNEWRMFIYLSKLKPETGYAVFSLLHIPLFMLIFWGLFSAAPEIKKALILFLNGFFVAHFFLHLMFIRHRNNEFRSVFSWGIIGGLFLIGIGGILTG